MWKLYQGWAVASRPLWFVLDAHLMLIWVPWVLKSRPEMLQGQYYLMIFPQLFAAPESSALFLLLFMSNPKKQLKSDILKQKETKELRRNNFFLHLWKSYWVRWMSQCLFLPSGRINSFYQDLHNTEQRWVFCLCLDKM